MRTARILVILSLLALAFSCAEEQGAQPESTRGPEKKEAPKAEDKKSGQKAEHEYDEEGKKAGEAGLDSKADTKEGQAAEGAVAKAGGSPENEPTEAPGQPGFELDRALENARIQLGLAPINDMEARILKILPPPLNLAFTKFMKDNLPKQVLAESGLSNLDWLDKSRPIKATRRGKDEAVIFVPVIRAQNFIAALPEAVRGEMKTLEGMRRVRLANAWVDITDREIMIAQNSEDLDKLPGKIKLELRQMEVKPLFQLTADGSSLHPFISTLLEGMEQSMDQMGTMDSASKDFFAKYFSFIKDLVGEIRSLELAMDVVEKSLSTIFTITPKPGSKAAAAIAKGPFNRPETLAYMPPKSWYIQGQNVPPAIFLPWVERYLDIVASAFRIGMDDKLRLAKDYKNLLMLYTGDVSSAIYADSGFPTAV